MRTSFGKYTRLFLPFLGLAMLSLIMLPSMFTPGKLLCGSIDARNYLFRLNELARLAERGVIWPRWGPDLAYGYGYPIFQFYGSLSLYPSLLLHWAGLSQVDALQAGFLLAFIISGWAAYIWLRPVTRDERAALVGAATYIFVPYHIGSVMHRLNLSEPWAMVWVPLALYGMHRMAQRFDWRSVGITALAVGAVPLTSNLATIVFAPILISYALLLLYQSRRRSTLFKLETISAGLSIGLAAFFFVPMIFDSHLIQVERGFSAGGINVFSNFLKLGQILQLTLTTDVSRVNPIFPTSLGPIAVTAALVALLTSWKKLPRSGRGHALWAIAVGAGCVFLVTRASAPVYRILAFLNVLQFPWRFLAPASLALAALTGVAALACLETLPTRSSPVFLGVTLIALAILGWPWAYPGPTCNFPPTPAVRDAVSYQVNTTMIGTITAEYVPTTVAEIPTTSPMVADYLNNRPVIRWDQSLLPDGGHTLNIQDDGLQGVWELDTPVPFEATYRAFMFPGWHATVDGRPVEIQITSPHGLIQIPIPAGHHTVAVRFGSTPDRTVSTILSAVALLVTGGLLLKSSPSPSGASLPRAPWAVVGVIGLTLLLVRVGLVDRFNWPPPLKRFDGQTIAGLAHPTSVAYSGGHRLLGYKLLTHPTSRGGTLKLDLYWATCTGADFRGMVRLRDVQGTAWTEWNETVDFPGFIPPLSPARWGPDLYAVIRYQIQIPPGIPPGEYHLSIETFDPRTLAKYYVTQGTPLDAERTEAIVGSVPIRRRRVPAAETTKLAAAGGTIPVADALTLVRCDVSRESAVVGETVVLQPLWYTDEASPPVTAFTLRLVDVTGRAALTETLPFSPLYPPDRWQSGDLVRDRLEILLPAGLPPGPYTWVAVVQGRELDLGALTVNTPERRMSLPLPNDALAIEQTLDGFATLEGYVASPLVAGHPFTVTLYWRAEGETTTNYKVFVHLCDSRGNVVAQSDAVPAAWARPTTSWLSPEIIEDCHVLSLPGDLSPGDYHLSAGLYDPKTGRRAVTSTGRDEIVITDLTPGAAP